MHDPEFLAIQAQLRDQQSKLAVLKQWKADPSVLSAQQKVVDELQMQLGQATVLETRVTLRELAAEMNMDRSACRRYILKLGYSPRRERTSESGFQVALTFSRSEADAIKAFRKSEGY